VVFALALLLLGAVALPGRADAEPSARQELSEVQRRLGDVRGDLAGARSDAAKLAAALRAADATLAAAETELGKAEDRWVASRLASQQAAEALSQATADVLRLEKVRGAQARESYMTGGLLTEFNALLQAKTLGDFSARAVTVQRAADAANTTLTESRNAEVRADQARRRMDAAEAAAKSRRAEVAGKVADLTEVRKVRADAKSRLDVQVASLSKKEASLSGQSSRLLAEVRAEEAAERARAAAAAAARAGREQAAGAVGAARAGRVRSSGGMCDLSGTSSAEEWIIMHESGGRPDADNPTSTAFGLGQLLLANRMRYLGSNYDTLDCGLQLGAFRAYVAGAYGTAEAAKAFWQANGWY
jgi:septal ring factor EnvC (AmiA/AmiB activator)